MRANDNANLLRKLSQACACILLSATCAVGADARSATYQLDIPAQSLAESLQALAMVSQHKLFYDAGLVKGKESPPLRGDFTAEEAVKRLLSGTNLSYEVTEDGLVLIRPSGAPAGSSSTRAVDGSVRWANTAFASPSPVEGAERSVEAAGNSSPQEGRSARVEEIVVTATRREEKLEDVPLSIAVITAADVDRRGLVSAEDYLRGIPGVNHASDTMGQSIVIRGIETSPSVQNFSSGATVATYFGETPTTTTATITGGTSLDVKLVDVERVEVLRGPQGTAFGSSSLGGAVRTIPVAPKLDRFETKVGASYSVTSGTGGDNHMLQAITNLPLITDKLALRAVAFRYDESGIYRNIAGSDPTFQSQAAVTGTQALAADADDVGASRFIGGRVTALFQATDALRFTVSYLTQQIEIDGSALANAGRYDQALLQLPPEYVDRGERGGIFDTNIDIASATVEYGLGWANLLASYSHIESENLPLGGSAATNPVVADPFAEHRAHIGEIRLVTQLDGAWNFLVGLYGEDLGDFYDTGHFIWAGSDAANPNGVRDLGHYVENRTLKQKAAFGEVSWEFLPRFTLTGGVRAYDYDRTGQVTNSGVLFGGGAVGPVMVAEASGTSFRGNLSHKLGDDALVYASWSQGFRIGKPQPGLSSATCDLNNDGIVDGTNSITIESTKSVDSDELDSYELGTNFALLDRRLRITADVFRMDWDGVPMRVRADACTGVTKAFNANAGSARSEGIEFQATFYMTDAVRLDFGASKIRARLTKDVPAQGFSAGDRLPGSPEVNANVSVEYGFDIAGYEASVRADSIYVGSFYGDIRATPNTEAGDYIKVDTSARVMLGNLKIDLFVRNLTNRDDFTFRGISDAGEFFGFRPRPRTIGFQLGYTF